MERRKISNEAEARSALKAVARAGVSIKVTNQRRDRSAMAG